MSAIRGPGPAARRTAGLALAAALTFSAIAAGVAGIGSVVLVQKEVLAIAAGQAARQVWFNDPVTDGLRVRLTQKDSLLKVRFFGAASATSAGPAGSTAGGAASASAGRGSGGARGAAYAAQIPAGGTYTLFGRCEAVLEQRPAPGAGGRLLNSILLLVGRLRLALLPGRDQPVEVQTPDAVMGIKGTYLRLLVDPSVGTFVAVDEGAVTVQARAGGGPVTVSAGSWVVVPPGGLASRPAPLPAPGAHDGILEDPPLLPCCQPIEGPKPRGQ
ncbi:MAG TPA: hypothetical protein VHR45_00415 [Thermoanaerobaculia bacterium]|nr:hypothetical protein [Thermoanaerobaculia bacterium]